MFDRIAPRYDRVNRVLSMGRAYHWRRVALESIRVAPGDRLIDLACGTGDLAELATSMGAEVFAIDFAREMLRAAKRRGIRAQWIQADAERIPLPDGSATCLTCGFALRNFSSLPKVLAETARVLEPGGRIALLEVDRPRNGVIRLGHSVYFERIVPRLGAWLSDRDAYRYLPESTVYLPEEAELLARIEAAGFEDVAKHSLLLGATQLLTAKRGG
jgi:demethylmenaquinone methyltransferase/2-methoxy-6-polyprenyl-1,4-benzoquinol methylase